MSLPFDLKRLEEILGFRTNYKSYSGTLVAGAPPLVLHVRTELGGHAGRRGWLRNDDAATSLYVSINNGDLVEVKFGEKLDLSYLTTREISLRSSGTPSFRILVW